MSATASSRYAFLVLAIVVACGVYTQTLLRSPPTAKQQKTFGNLTNLAQESEFDQARIAVVHEPSYELFLSALHPEGHLFEQPIHVPESVEHHRNLQLALERHGVTVLKVAMFCTAYAVCLTLLHRFATSSWIPPTEIRRFDRSLKMKPFDFFLSPTTESTHALARKSCTLFPMTTSGASSRG